MYDLLLTADLSGYAPLCEVYGIGTFKKIIYGIYRLGIRYIENISKKGHVAGRYQEVLQPEIHFV